MHPYRYLDSPRKGALGFDGERRAELAKRAEWIVGNVYATGYLTSEMTYHDFATAAYSSSGTPLWTNLYDGGPGNYNDVAQSLAVVADGVVVTGNSARVGQGNDFATIKYSAAGVALWTNWYGGAQSQGDVPVAVAADSTGAVVVTGQSISTN